MSNFKTWSRIVGLQALRCGLFAIGAAVLAFLIVSAWLRLLLTPMLPMIYAALPKHYRRTLVLLAKAMPKHRNRANQEPAA